MNPKDLKALAAYAADKENFTQLQNYYDFAARYLDYIAGDNLQAVIVSQNTPQYRFFQYSEEAQYRVTRAINSKLLYDANNYVKARDLFTDTLTNIRNIDYTEEVRDNINRHTYTIQQCVGAALDALPSGQANRARKVNGDLFERLILLLFEAMNIRCTSGTIKVPVKMEGKTQFHMRYQHDLIIEEGEVINLIGSVKTSSKDRIDKIFIDKYLHNKLTGKQTPHIAIFLNDIQRKEVKKEGAYGTSWTFLPGRFKGYTVKLNPLDGVYYCDILPQMRTEPIVKDHIDTFDHLLCDDIWRFVRAKDGK